MSTLRKFSEDIKSILSEFLGRTDIETKVDFSYGEFTIHSYQRYRSHCTFYRVNLVVEDKDKFKILDLEFPLLGKSYSVDPELPLEDLKKLIIKTLATEKVKFIFENIVS